jgi:hypothetical protein
MKIEELNPEQIGKARALETNEERLDYLKECGVELDEDMLANVAGGMVKTGPKKKKKECSESPDGAHEWEKTGNRKKGRWIGIVDDVEYRCKHCGKVEWKLW